MPLHEIHLVLPPGDDLVEAVDQLLLAVRRDPLDASFVLDDHRAQRFDLVLIGE